MTSTIAIAEIAEIVRDSSHHNDGWLNSKRSLQLGKGPSLPAAILNLQPNSSPMANQHTNPMRNVLVVNIAMNSDISIRLMEAIAAHSPRLRRRDRSHINRADRTGCVSSTVAGSELKVVTGADAEERDRGSSCNSLEGWRTRM